MIEKVKLFAVHGDGGERGVGPIIGYYSTEELAKIASKQQGWYGSDGWITAAWAFKDGEDYWILASGFPSKVIA